jgi:hypothetical protein
MGQIVIRAASSQAERPILLRQYAAETVPAVHMDAVQGRLDIGFKPIPAVAIKPMNGDVYRIDRPLKKCRSGTHEDVENWSDRIRRLRSNRPELLAELF